MNWVLWMCAIGVTLTLVTATNDDCTCDFDSVDNVFNECYECLPSVMADAMIEDCNAMKGGPDFSDLINNLKAMCKRKCDIEVKDCEECLPKCDFDKAANPFNECWNGLPDLMQEALIKDCEAMEDTDDFEDFIEDIIAMCFRKFDIVIVIVCDCPTCDFDDSANVFYDCWNRFPDLMQPALIEDCKALKDTDDFDDFIEDIIAMCLRKFDMVIKLDCEEDEEGCREEHIPFGDIGADYRGTLSHTVSGKTCQRWDSQTPHANSWDTDVYPQVVYNEANYCRNPDLWGGGLWCFTTDPDTRWERCSLPLCDDLT